MKIHPILFSTDMVKALLQGRKTQTRRLIKVNGPAPYQVGDVLWVRESFYSKPEHNTASPKQLVNAGLDIYYLADLTNELIIKPVKERRTRPSIHMPKEACRIFLEVTEVRSQKLQDISDTDCLAEGVIKHDSDQYGAFPKGLPWNQPLLAFRFIWLLIHGLASWNANPWVWAYTFKRVERPANFLNS